MISSTRAMRWSTCAPPVRLPQLALPPAHELGDGALRPAGTAPAAPWADLKSIPSSPLTAPGASRPARWGCPAGELGDPLGQAPVRLHDGVGGGGPLASRNRRIKAMFTPRSLSTLVMWATTPGLSCWTTMTVLYSPVKSTDYPVDAGRCAPCRPPGTPPAPSSPGPAAFSMRMSTVLGCTSVSVVAGGEAEVQTPLPGDGRRTPGSACRRSGKAHQPPQQGPVGAVAPVGLGKGAVQGEVRPLHAGGRDHLPGQQRRWPPPPPCGSWRARSCWGPARQRR